MLKYTPKPITANVNVPPSSALGELCTLLGGIAGILIGLYLLLGLLVNILAPVLPQKVESMIANFYYETYLKKLPEQPQEKYVQAVLARLTPHLRRPGLKFQIKIRDDPEINAFAFPGGFIVVNTGLLQKIGSENELAMVLAHELGHFENYDHIKQIGRALLFLTISTLILGEQNNVNQLLQKTLLGFEMNFSQHQESDADTLGIAILQAGYHNCRGALEFFERILEEKRDNAGVFVTHPATGKRKENLVRLIEKSACPIGEKIPLYFQWP